jgi:hypothetical protein
MAIPKSDLIKALNVAGQFILDNKLYFLTLDDMRNLGLNNNLAYTYYEGMEVFCLQTFKKYYWKERTTQIGVLYQDFTYESGVIANNIDYSLRHFNFIDIENDIEILFIKPTILNYLLGSNIIYKKYKFSSIEEGLQLSDIKYNTERYYQDGIEHNLTELFNNTGTFVNYLTLEIRNIFISEDETAVTQRIGDFKNGIYYERMYMNGQFHGFTEWKRIDNVQGDWNQVNSLKPDYIKNKPRLQSFTQIQSDWTQNVNTATDYIKNKPTIPIVLQPDWLQNNNTLSDYIKNKPTIPIQIQPDWNQSNNVEPDYIKNKPTIPTLINADWNQNNPLSPDYILNKPIISTGNVRQIWYQLDNWNMDVNFNYSQVITTSISVADIDKIVGINVVIRPDDYFTNQKYVRDTELIKEKYVIFNDTTGEVELHIDILDSNNFIAYQDTTVIRGYALITLML